MFKEPMLTDEDLYSKDLIKGANQVIELLSDLQGNYYKICDLLTELHRNKVSLSFLNRYLKMKKGILLDKLMTKGAKDFKQWWYYTKLEDR